ncbi:MAG TPA: hypothetical protein GX707_17130 [Epulopiscium sp.]|nr:hypothetical protein [Candidatus Epulonipiscium sp.]
MMKKTIISVIVGMSLMTSVFAAPGAQETPMNLDADAAIFSVTVPSTMQIHVDENGVVTTPSVVTIVNNSSAPVIVTNVEVTKATSGTWDIVDFNTDMLREKLGTKKVGIKINECETDSSGIFQFNTLNFPSINGSESLALTYDAVVPTQKTVIADTDIAKVTFTIGWDE